ncbi:MAG: NAD(P)H-binding protein [bacterium]|nr:NAD(P)H-binding protein [bacterium]
MSNSQAADHSFKILLTGATGYVGGQLLERLVRSGFRVRCLTRNPSKLEPFFAGFPEYRSQIHVVRGDVMQPESLQPALQGIETAYYLVHSMATAENFEELDRQAARNFVATAEGCGVGRIIYLGGLGEDTDPNLSPHLRSRHEVGQILRESGVLTIEFRASAVLGQGSLSFELIRSLTERLPIMICPRWLSTPTQPIAIRDLVEYLFEAQALKFEGSQIFEIGGSDVVTYGGLIREFARQRGLKRWLISVPILTPYLSGLWLGLVTPATAEVGRHLIEGLRNPTTVRDARADQFFAVKPMGVRQALQEALLEDDTAQDVAQ